MARTKTTSRKNLFAYFRNFAKNLIKTDSPKQVRQKFANNFCQLRTCERELASTQLLLQKALASKTFIKNQYKQLFSDHKKLKAENDELKRKLAEMMPKKAEQ